MNERRARTGMRQGPDCAVGQGSTRRGGFTLLEILVVLGVLVALVGIAWPALDNRIINSEIPESTSKLRSLLFMTRAQAILDHKRYRVKFSRDSVQPVVEVEPDPIFASGQFVATNELWAMENILLGDVRVHAVKLGRPVYMTPQQTRDDAEAQSDEGLNALLTKAQAEVAEMVQGEKQTGLDDKNEWPTILFNVDGSTDWATIIVSRIDPKDDIKIEDEQQWIVLDGRTGLAQITAQVTEQQLADAGFYVDRDKLAMPETGESGEMTFTSPADAQQASQNAAAGASSLAGGASGNQLPNTGRPGSRVDPPPVNASDVAKEVSGAGNSGLAAKLANMKNGGDNGQKPPAKEDGSGDNNNPRKPTDPNANGGRRPGGADTPQGQKPGGRGGAGDNNGRGGGGRGNPNAGNQNPRADNPRGNGAKPGGNGNSGDSMPRGSDDPNLTDQQREQIRKQFRNGGRR